MLSISTETDSDSESDSLCSAEHKMHYRQLSLSLCCSLAISLSLTLLLTQLNLNLNSTQLVGGAPCGGTSKMQKSKLKMKKKIEKTTRKIGLKKKMNENVLFTEHRVLTIHTHTSKQ